MSKTASPTVIGGFVLAAVFLIAVAAMLFGGAQLFARQDRLVSYFPGSVKGLRDGANVLFRGVRVGYVESIQLQGDVDSGTTLVQVVLRVYPDLYQLTRSGRPVQDPSDVGNAGDMVDAGLRAQLGVESFVTGQLVVEFDFFPDSEVTFHGVNPPYQEIPTIPNDIEQIVENVQTFVADIQKNLDIEQLTQDVQAAVHGLRELVNSDDLKQAIAGLNGLMSSDKTQRLPDELDATLADARATLDSIRTLSDDTDARLGPLIDQLTPAVAKLTETLAAAESTLKSAGEQLRGDTELAYRVTDTLAEVEAASRALRVFLDYLDRHPEALLHGKRQP